MRVLFISRRDLDNPLAGGSEVLVHRLADGLVDRGHQVDLLCGGPVEARTYGTATSGGPYGHYLQVPVHYLRRYRTADVVVDVVNGMPYFSPVWRRRPSICLVNHVHTDQWSSWFPAPVAAFGRGIERRVFPVVYRRNLIMAVSDSTAVELARLGLPPDRIRVVHNGVDVAPVRPLKSPDPLFVAVGRLVPYKRFDLLVRLWEKVRPITGGRLVIAGDGPELGRLRQMAGVDVSLPGWIPAEDKDDLLRRAWLLLHPSEVEGWGLVVMEAGAWETPAVGFDVRGVRDSVAHGHSGVLVGSEDELVRTWTALAADGCARRALGRNARRRALEFSWSKTVDGFLDVAHEAVGNGPVPSSPDVVAPVGLDAWHG
jgi:glycosyltransferase involved in cell wall biosynthesis